MPLIPYFGSYAFATVTILCAANEFTILKIDCFDFREPPEEDKGAESSRQSAKPSFERFFIF